jgi:hypothetical protein
MNRQFLSAIQWKYLLLTVWLSIMALNIWATMHADRQADPAVAGTLGAVFGKPDRDYHAPILSMALGSPLLAAGAKPGDAVVLDHFGDWHRYLAVGEIVGATLFRTGGSEHVQLRAIPNPSHESLLSVTLGWIAPYLGLTCGLLIGLRRFDSRPMRVLAIVLMCFGLGSYLHALPGGIIADLLARIFFAVSGFTAFVFFLYFTLIFPEEAPLMRAKAVRMSFMVFVGSYILFTVLAIAHYFSLLPWALREWISFPAWHFIQATIAVLASLTALLYSWYRSTGITKQKLTWITLSMGTEFASFPVDAFNAALGNPIPAEILEVATTLIQASAICALVYALLRHRLFDFGFALNRALVVTILSTFLLIVFSLTEWGVDKLLHFQGREKNVVFDAAVALAVILSFHRIQHWISHQVDHLFFHHWYAAAERLRQFMQRAAHISDAAVLQLKFINAVEEYAGAEGAATYLIGGSTRFQLEEATLPDAPASVDANNDALVIMRSGHKVVFLSDCRQSLPGELALPLMVRGSVNGFVLLGAKKSGQQYRPDEIELLTTCVQQLGLDLESLKAIELQRRALSSEGKIAHFEQRIIDLERACAAQEHALRLAAG